MSAAGVVVVTGGPIGSIIGDFVLRGRVGREAAPLS